MKVSILASVIWLAIPGLALSVHAADATHAMPDPADSSKTEAIPTDAAGFVKMASVAGMFEVQTSQLALEKTTDSSLKSFAQEMVDDHTKANTKLKSLVQSGKVTGVKAVPSALDAKHQAKLDKLKGANASEFDQDYRKVQLKAHQTAVQLFTAQSENGEDPELKKFAAETLPTLKHHLEEIQSLQVSDSRPQ